MAEPTHVSAAAEDFSVPPGRWNRLAQVAGWGVYAVLAVLVVSLIARTEPGAQRLHDALARIAGRHVAPPPDPRIARNVETENEVKRLTEAMRALAADRDRLQERVATLERNLDDVTGSISHTTRTISIKPPTEPPASAEPPESAERVPPAPLALAPPAATPSPPSAAVSTSPPAAAPIPPQAATPPAAIPVPLPRPQPVVTAPAAPTANRAVATKTEFGVDVGGGRSVENLQVLWFKGAARPAAGGPAAGHHYP
jgi:hypothetical protein